MYKASQFGVPHTCIRSFFYSQCEFDIVKAFDYNNNYKIFQSICIREGGGWAIDKYIKFQLKKICLADG